KAENKADYINQWLIHRLRTSPLEAEQLLAICEGTFRVVNLRRWQEEVLYYWRLDEAAVSPAGWASSGGEREREPERGETKDKDGQQPPAPLPPPAAAAGVDGGRRRS